jgi:hypothetical protein
VAELMDLFEALIISMRVDDRLLLTLSPLCLSTLAIEPSLGDVDVLLLAVLTLGHRSNVGGGVGTVRRSDHLEPEIR